MSTPLEPDAPLSVGDIDELITATALSMSTKATDWQTGKDLLAKLRRLRADLNAALDRLAMPDEVLEVEAAPEPSPGYRAARSPMPECDCRRPMTPDGIYHESTCALRLGTAQ